MRISVSYWQAWHAKAYGRALIEGCPEESHTRLPGYFYNLELHNPGTFTRINTDSSGTYYIFHLIIIPRCKLMS